MLQQNYAAYRGYREPGIRLSETLADDFKTPTDGAKVGVERAGAAVRRFDRAHVVMLVEQQILTRDVGAAILRELLRWEAQGDRGGPDLASEDRHASESHLIRTLGEDVGGRISLARSSGDLGAVARRIVARTFTHEVMSELSKLRDTLISLGLRYRNCTMPAYTHGEPAQATTFGHYLFMWAQVFARDFSRLSGLYGRINMSPAGACIMTGSDFPLNRERTAELLGFDGPIVNTMDAILSHDTDCLECASDLAIVGSNLSRLAEDVQLWGSPHYGFIRVPDRYCETSSIMMQKRNPVFAERIKSAGNVASGALATAVAVERGPSGVAQAERRQSEKAVWSAFGSVIDGIRLARQCVEAIELDEAQLHAGAAAEWTQATDLGSAIVRHADVPWRTAHQIVGILVRLCVERDIRPADVTSELVDEASVAYFGAPVGLPLFEIRRALDPLQFIQRRGLLGGPAPEAVKRDSGLLITRLNLDLASFERQTNQLQASERVLESAINTLLASDVASGRISKEIAGS